MWYELVIKSWGDFNDISRSIHSDVIPRVGEIIENYKAIDGERNLEYQLTLKVEKVSHILFTNHPSSITVYAIVIESKLI